MRSDICVISCYFNPCNYQSKRENAQIFIEHLKRLEVPLYLIEAAATPDSFALEIAHKRVLSKGTLWQKERLLNLIIRSVPDHHTKIAWIDADVIFENHDWLSQTSEALEHFEVVQPFSTVVRLPRFERCYQGRGEKFKSFASLQYDIDAAPRVASGFPKHWHGHPGFAWAARRSWLSTVGLYDACLSGSADHLMAHVFYGDLQSACLARAFQRASRYKSHFYDWAERVRLRIGGLLGHVPGQLLHLWHGEESNRQYFVRDGELNFMGFDPQTDLKVGSDGLWELTGANPDLEIWTQRYFHNRREDSA